MRLEINVAACQGHGRCAAVAPNLFHLNEDGYVETERIDVPEEYEPEARAAIANCPELIISAGALQC